VLEEFQAARRANCVEGKEAELVEGGVEVSLQTFAILLDGDVFDRVIHLPS
jgi:hypothetical protein